MPNDNEGITSATAAAEKPSTKILDKAKKLTDALGALVGALTPILIPIVLLWLGQAYTAQQARWENERADFDRMSLILDRFASDNPKKRMEAVHVLNFFVEKCEFTSILGPALQQGLNDTDPNVVNAARGVLSYAITVPQSERCNPAGC